MTNQSDQLTSRMVVQVEPVLRQYAAAAETNRRLSPEVVQALIDSGITRVVIPKAYGGQEMEPVGYLKLLEALARIDSATAWVSSLFLGISGIGGVLPKEAGDEMYADPRSLFAGAWFPPGGAEPVEGGYRVSGQWAFGSGSNYATWLSCQVVVMENGAPKIGPNGGPIPLILFMKGSEAEVLDNWDALGMRGTGSHDFRAEGVFVPERRVWPIGPYEIKNPAFAGPNFRLGLWIVPALNAAVTLGIARAAVDDLMELAGQKTPSYTQIALTDKPVVQEHLARARAQVEAGESYLYSAIGSATEYVQSAPKCDIEHGMPIALACSFAVEAAAKAVDLVHACAGTSGIRVDRSFQQHFRDVHTVSQHAFSSTSRYESIGKLMLGKESDWVFYYL
jgi:indole-3-acetate monooxygenase